MDYKFNWILESQRLGFLGPSAPDIHLEQALFFSELVLDLCSKFSDCSTLSLFDLGTGGGFPGLVLAQVLDGVQVYLVESMGKRATFLDDCAGQYEIRDRCKVMHGRAEVFGHVEGFRESAQFVTAKAFGKAAVTAECASGLVAVGGYVLVSDPPVNVYSDGDRWNTESLDILGLKRIKSVSVPFAITVLEKVEVLDDKFPRETQRLLKNPLF